LRRALSRKPLIGLLVLALLVLVAYLSGLGAPTRGAVVHGGSPTSAVTDRVSGLPVVPLSALPSDARHTIALIAAGGPFPYVKDGAVFGNVEGLLPAEPTGYYKEYTVATPGAHDRGARRVITGDRGELYYTSDHYASFFVVDVSGPP
jgi:ribonuclease T1